MRLVRLSVSFFLLLSLVGCATPIRVAEQHIGQDEWMKAVVEYRRAVATQPNDVELRSRLRQTELKAADYYYQLGLRSMEQGNFDAALGQYQQGLAAMPDHSKLLQAMAETIARKEALTLYQEGVHLRDAGKIEEAMRQFERTLQVYPNHKESAAALAELRSAETERLTEEFALTSKAPITLNFRQTDLKQAFEFLARAFGVNVIFDETLRAAPVTLFAKDVTFEQGLSLLLATSKTFYKRIGPNTVLIATDSKDKRDQYEDHIVRTYTLNTIRAKEMADMLKGLITIKKLAINEQLNTLTIRDTENVLRLADRLIENNDRKPAEIIMDVEILEVNRNKSERLGLDFGSYEVTAIPPKNLPLLTSMRPTFRSSATLSIPSVTLRFFKQDVDAKTLANPKVRVVTGKTAKIHIGDRVPLRAATIIDATGQTRTTFEYKDIGIRLTVDPIVHLDNSATVKLGLEVSSLGENLGTTAEPAFRIGTRNAETSMLLRDGETAILGGLIRDEERETRTRIPGLGDIPAVGALFTSHDDSGGRTDVLLTITPRVVRGWDLPTQAARQFHSGTESVYSDKPLFSSLETSAGAEIRGAGSALAAAVTPTVAASPIPPPAILSPAVTPATAPPIASPLATPAGATPVATGALPVTAAAPSVSVLGAPASLMFSDAIYEATAGQEFEIKIVGTNLGEASNLPLEVLYNPQLLAFVNGSKGDVPTNAFNASADASRGLLQVSLGLAAEATAGKNATLARIKLRGVKPGVSYLVYRAPSVKSANGEAVNAQVRASRVVIK